MPLPPLDQIDGSVIQGLVDDGVAEQRSLDYKETLPGGSDNDKKEFLADVASLANSGGGYILYGIRDRRDKQGRSTGEPDVIVGLPNANLDQEILRLEQVIRTAIAPRVAGVDSKVVTVANAKDPVLVLSIPQSFNAPHMVTFKGSSRFFARSSAGKYQLDVHEIRAAFLATDSVTERIRAFRADRLAKILAGETPVALDQKTGLVVIHVVPLASLAGTASLDIRRAARNVIHHPISTTRDDQRFNLDGFFTHGHLNKGRASSYSQCFRDGRIEFVNTRILQPTPVDGKTQHIPSFTVGRKVHAFLTNVLAFYKACGIRAPAVLMMSMLAIGDYDLGVGRDFELDFGQVRGVDRSNLLFSEVLIENLDADVQAATRPILDELWQAFGLERCFDYDDKGNWIGR